MIGGANDPPLPPFSAKLPLLTVEDCTSKKPVSPTHAESRAPLSQSSIVRAYRLYVVPSGFNTSDHLGVAVDHDVGGTADAGGREVPVVDGDRDVLGASRSVLVGGD